MEQFNTLVKENYAKLRDLFMSMTLGNRIVASLLVATLLLSLGYLVVGSIQTTDPLSRTIMWNDGYQFNVNERGAAEHAFASRRLTDHVWVGNRLQIPTSQRIAYGLALAEADVLERSGHHQQTAAGNLSAWQSARMMDTQMLIAKQQDTVDAITKIPGISSARILTHRRPEWERNVWARRQVISVSVTLEAIENRPLSVETITAVGNLVANAFGVTDRREISITDTRHSRSYDGFGEEVSSAQGEYLRHQNRWQETWNNRIHQHLPAIPGLRVETSVSLTTHRTQRIFTVEHDRPTPLVIHELDYHFRREGWDRFFRPGQIAQWSRPLIDPTGDVGPRDVTDEKRREMETTHALPGREMTEEQLPYVPQLVTVSIQIPRDHILAIWRERNRQLGGDPDTYPTEEQLYAAQESFANDTRRSVGALLVNYRPNARTDPMELVEVVYFDRILEIETELTAWQQFLLFLQYYWQSLALMSLVAGGLVVLWSISRPQKPDNIVIYEGLETPLEAIDARIADRIRREEEAAAIAAAAAEEERQEFENSLGELGSLRSLKDEIAELIAKNPEAAAAVIRQWVGNAVLVEAKT